MRPRTEALIAVGALALLATLAATLGEREGRSEQEDPRASSFLPGPRGTRGLADGLTRLGVRVERFRRRPRQLALDSTREGRSILALVDPDFGFTVGERSEILAWHAGDPGGDLLLAGRGASGLMRCFGYRVDWRAPDSVALRGRPGWPPAAGVLAGLTDSVVTDSSRLSDVGLTGCAVPPIGSTDTLLTTATGRVVVLRLTRSDVDRQVILLADAGLLRNRAIRETPAGPFALGLLRGYDRVLFEEAHHGFGSGGSLAGATFEWSRHSPWGWAAWQLAIVGLLALVAGAFRFGPVRPVIQRRRRSPLEHVRALATALAAARGHDVAIGAIVQGLRRRLQPAGQRSRADWRAWVAHLADTVRSARARDAARTLASLTRPGQPPEGVLRAANAVEDVWEELRP
jgi:Domain of unknown function (DUF4350)